MLVATVLAADCMKGVYEFQPAEPPVHAEHPRPAEFRLAASSAR